MIRSVQLQWTRLTVFLPTTLHLERFWREFKLPLKSHKPVSRAYRTEMVFLTFLMTFNFTFFISDTSNAILEGEQLPCRGTSALKCVLKINWTYKRCPTLETAAYGNVKIQSLCGNLVKRGFVKVAVSRAVRLREYPLGELSLYS